MKHVFLITFSLWNANQHVKCHANCDGIEKYLMEFCVQIYRHSKIPPCHDFVELNFGRFIFIFLLNSLKIICLYNLIQVVYCKIIASLLKGNFLQSGRTGTFIMILFHLHFPSTIRATTLLVHTKLGNSTHKNIIVKIPTMIYTFVKQVQ